MIVVELALFAVSVLSLAVFLFVAAMTFDEAVKRIGRR